METDKPLDFYGRPTGARVRERGNGRRGHARFHHDGGGPGLRGLILGIAVVSLVLAGCVTPPHARKDLLDFFAIGKTTREEVLLKLGQPSASFERDKILTYRVGQYGEEGYFIISPKVVLPAQGASWQNVRFSLVIVFDEQGRLQKHQLVQVD